MMSEPAERWLLVSTFIFLPALLGGIRLIGCVCGFPAVVILPFQGMATHSPMVAAMRAIAMALNTLATALLGAASAAEAATLLVPPESATSTPSSSPQPSARTPAEVPARPCRQPSAAAASCSQPPLAASGPSKATSENSSSPPPSTAPIEMVFATARNVNFKMKTGKFHNNSACYGLRNAGSDVLHISRSDAEAKGLSPGLCCSWP